MNGKVWYQETIPTPKLTEDVFVLRREIAQKEKEKTLLTEKPVTLTPPTSTPPAWAPKELIRKIYTQSSSPFG